MKQDRKQVSKGKHTRSQITIWCLTFWTLFIGIGAVAGATMMLYDPSGKTIYDHVTICTPIWAFSLAAPVREFCQQAAGKIQSADYVLVHHTKGQCRSVAREMDRLLGIAHGSCINVCCRKGDFLSASDEAGQCLFK